MYQVPGTCAVRSILPSVSHPQILNSTYTRRFVREACGAEDLCGFIPCSDSVCMSDIPGSISIKGSRISNFFDKRVNSLDLCFRRYCTACGSLVEIRDEIVPQTRRSAL